MTTEEITIREGEAKVYPRHDYEVVQCTDGQPLAVATFRDAERAREYARALNKRYMLAETLGKMEDVLLCAARWAECQRKGDAELGRNIFDCDFDGALQSLKDYRAFRAEVDDAE